MVVLPARHATAQNFSLVPGTVIGYRPGSTNQYLSSPSIAILPNGDYVASHDLFGGGFNEEASGLTTVYRSTNSGTSWSRISEVKDMHFSSLFTYESDLYVLGSRNGEGGDLLIRKSTDGGVTWTAPTDSNSGLLFSGSFGGTSHNPVAYDGRIWAMTHTQASPAAISAPIGSDLLQASSWTLSNHITKDNSWLDGYPDADLQRWTEAQPVASPELGVVYLPKLHDARYTAFIRADSSTGNVSFDPTNDFAFMPGAEKKFGISYDPVSQKYWATSNPVLEEHEDDFPDVGGSTRNTAALLSSPDLRDWKLESVFLYNPESHYHAFQYLNFAIDGDDLAVVSRTAFDDGLGGADSYHDNNFMTFHRVENFRNLSPTHVLVADTNNNRVVRYQTLDGMPWAPLENFATGSYAGAALDKPLGLTQTANGDVFIGEEKVGGRILRFDAAGNFLEVVATEGADFQGNPEALVKGPDGNLYLSAAFGANSDRVYRIDPDTNQVELFIDTTFDNGSRSFDDPRGLAFDSLGNLYIADRDGTDTGSPAQNLVRKFDGHTGEFIENFVAVNKPQGLDWDDMGNRLLLSADSPVDIVSLTNAGVATPLYSTPNDVGNALDLEVIDGEIVWTDFNNNRLDKLVGINQRETVVSGLNGPGHLLEVSLPNQRTWISSSDGRWREGQNWNWLWGIANEAEEVAVFNGSGGGIINIQLLDPTTVGGIQFLGSASHTISGSSPLTISSVATDKLIQVRGGEHIIQVPLKLPQGMSIDLAQASKLTLDSNVLVSANRLELMGAGQLIINGSLSFNDQEGEGIQVTENAILSGTGSIGGHVTNVSGIVSPGNSLGSMIVSGNFKQFSAGEFYVEIAGDSVGQFDSLAIGGKAILSGDLAVSFINPEGYSPVDGDSFVLISAAGGIEGVFSDFELPSLAGGLLWAVQNQANSLRLFIDSGSLDGDFDFDGDVDGTDFLTWQRNPALGNLSSWRDNYGSYVIHSSSSIHSAVPEPNVFALILIVSGALLNIRNSPGLKLKLWRLSDS